MLKSAELILNWVQIQICVKQYLQHANNSVLIITLVIMASVWFTSKTLTGRTLTCKQKNKIKHSLILSVITKQKIFEKVLTANEQNHEGFLVPWASYG